MSSKHKSPFLKTLRNDAIYVVLRAGLMVIRMLPRKVSLVFITSLARLGYWLAPCERHKMVKNLEDAFGKDYTPAERHRIGEQVFRHIAGNAIDAVLLERLLTKSPEDIMRIEGLEIAQKAMAHGKGVVFLTAHMGCFEMLSPRFSQLGFPVLVAGTRIYDPRIDALVAENRARFNVEYIPREGNLRSIIRGLRQGKAFGVLCDLDTRVESLFIPFFDRPAKTPVAPFKLALRTGAAMVPIFAQRQPDGSQRVIVYPPIEPSTQATQDPEARLIEVMTAYNRTLEELIRRDPTQWIWMHNRWKSKPETAPDTIPEIQPETIEPALLEPTGRMQLS